MERDSSPTSEAQSEYFSTMEDQGGMIRDSSHIDVLVDGLYNMYLSSESCDITLEVGTSSILAHKNVLMASSSYFRNMFSHNLKEAETGVVSFSANPHVTLVGLKAVLEYAYTGCLQINEQNVRDILKIASHFVMSDVIKICEYFLLNCDMPEEKHLWIYELARDFLLNETVKEELARRTKRIIISADNYLDILVIAIFCNDSDLLSNAVGYFTSKLPFILSDEDLVDRIDGESLFHLLKRISHGFYTNMALIQFLVKWAEHSTCRSSWLCKLLREINLLCFDERELDAIEQIEIIKNTENCKKLVTETKKQLTEVNNDECYSIVFSDEEHIMFQEIKEGCGKTQDESEHVQGTISKLPLPTPHFRRGLRRKITSMDDTLFIFNAYETYHENDGNVLLHCFKFHPHTCRWSECLPLEIPIDLYSEYRLFEDAGLFSKRKEVCVIVVHIEGLYSFLYEDVVNEWSTNKMSMEYGGSVFRRLDDTTYLWGVSGGRRRFQRLDPDNNTLINLNQPDSGVPDNIDNLYMPIATTAHVMFHLSKERTFQCYNPSSDEWSYLEPDNEECADFNMSHIDLLPHEDSIFLIDNSSSHSRIAKVLVCRDRWSLGTLNEFLVRMFPECVIRTPRNCSLFREK